MKLLTYLDQVPILGLLVAALLLGLAPFQPQPHLLEKLNSKEKLKVKVEKDLKKSCGCGWVNV